MLTKLQQQPHLQPSPSPISSPVPASATAPSPATVFDSIYAETPTALDMSDRDFEKFMKTLTDIKVDMMTILADSFKAIAQVKL